MDQVRRHFGHLSHADASHGGDAFGSPRPRIGEVRGAVLAIRVEAPRQVLEAAGVFDVEIDHAAVAADLRHHPHETVDVVLERPHHEDLEARMAVRDDVGDLLDGGVVGLEDRHVEAVVDDGLVAGLGVPGPDRLQRGLAGAGQRVVDERGDTAAGRRDGAAMKILDRLQALELHVDVGVHVDGARQQVEAGNVDLPLRWAEVETEARNLAALDADVGVEGVAGRDDRAAAQDQVHLTPSLPAAPVQGWRRTTPFSTSTRSSRRTVGW